LARKNLIRDLRVNNMSLLINAQAQLNIRLKHFPKVIKHSLQLLKYFVAAEILRIIVQDTALLDQVYPIFR